MSYNCIPAGLEDDDEDFVKSISTPIQNLKITVVPDITCGAGLDNSDFDHKLSPEMERWFINFRMNKTSAMATSALKQVFLSSENPLVLALKFFANSPDCNRNGKFKDNISVIILETICTLTDDHPHISYNHSSDNLSMVVFNFTKKGMKPKLIQELAKAYNMKAIKHLLIPKIHEMLKENEYQSAAYWAIALEITNEFTIYDIILPLIFRELHEVTTKYLDEAKDLQRPLIEFLDTLMDNQYTVAHYIGDLTAKYHYDISNTGKCRITAKSLRNQIDKLSKRYKIPFEATPYTSFSKNLAYINYLLHKRYIEGDQMSKEALRELVKETAVTQKLQEELVITICQYGDKQEAKYFLDFYQLSSDTLPCGSLEDVKIGEKTKSDEKHSNFHKLKLPLEKIVWVDSDESIVEMIKELETCSVVAFDSEWKPHSTNNDEAVSLLQLAIPSKVFLVDALSNKITVKGWKKIGSEIFNNLEITKIGFSITHDLQMFFKYLPDMEFTFMHLSPNYLDLDTLWDKLNDISYFTFPYQKYNVERHVARGFKTSSAKSGGLSMLTQLCFGKKLDKSNQISNWGNRPLRHDQVVYAAIDAYCLIEIYDLLFNRMLKFNCSAKMLMTDVMLADQKRLTKIEKTVKKNKVFNSKHKQTNKVQIDDGDDSTMKVQRCEEPPTKRTEVQTKPFTNSFIYEDQLGTHTHTHATKGPGRRGTIKRPFFHLLWITV
ncbi:EXD3 family protein [Megaselia abdita]